MSPWVREISFIDDVVPHRAALNMAIDEALLAIVPGPVLRIYRWARPAVSFGYFERWAPVRAAHPGREPVRRWTGGGVVLHGDDLTYSLLVPAGIAVADAAGSYAIIHGALRAALADAGIRAQPASAPAAKMSRECFENPVPHDVLAGGRKVAGAAQRRTRAGLLHQGSIQGLDLPPGFGAIFAARLAAVVNAADFDVAAAAGKLAAEKYGAAHWLDLRP